MITDKHSQVQFNTKEGWLAKTGSNNKGWRDRYFILSNGKMTYYKSDKDNEPQGFIDLKEVHEVVSAQGKKGYGFDLLVPGRVYNMSAKSSIEEDDWITAIKQSLEIIRKIYGMPSADSYSSNSSSRKSTASFSGGGFLLNKKKTVVKERSESTMDEESDTADSFQRSISPPQSNPRSDIEINNLLDAQVDLLKKKVSELERNLQDSVSKKKDLQHKMEENRTAHDIIAKKLNSEITLLKTKISSLEESKLKLETVNDSLSAQVQDKDEVISNLQQAIDELKDIEEESKQFQEEAALAKKHLDEAEETFRNKVKSEKTSFIAEKQKLNELLQQSEEKLESTEKERDRYKAALDLQRQKSEPAIIVDESELKEEKLQLQLELENLKASMNKEIEEKKSAYDKDRQSFFLQLETSRQQCIQLKENLENATCQLSEANKRNSDLKGTVRAAEEKRNQLQIEKDKVMSDLITLRKSMKEKEKVLSDDEAYSPVPKKTEGSPTLTAKLADAENRAEMATKLLQEIQSERDSLRAQLNRRCSPSPTHNSVNGNGAFPPFLIKSQPTITLSSPDIPPPKPKRPPKEILDKLLKL